MKPGDYQLKIQAEEYYKTRFGNGLEIVNKDEMDLLKHWLAVYGNPKESTVFLDVGTGTGRLLDTILNFQPAQVIALDNSQAMLDYLKHVYNREVSKKTIRLVKSKADKTLFNNNSIDIITGFHLMKHLGESESVIKESYSILKRNGFVVFDFLNKNSLIRFNVSDCFALTEKQIRNMLMNNGFKIIEIKYMHAFGETIYKFLNHPLVAIFHTFDNFFSDTFKAGTKIFVIAQKL